ncbi:oleate hydratase [Clostridium sp. CF011]|nr:oleate hydratase [Clostridium sp. CF011]WAG71617.1 oleate hydratase [Clostridium sp. CF011]
MPEGSTNLALLGQFCEIEDDALKSLQNNLNNIREL